MGRRSETKHPMKYVCPFCEKRYTSRSGLLSHKNKIHLHRKPYRCEFCNEHFYTSASRVAHIHRWHEKSEFSRGAIVCKICGELFLQDTHYEEHLFNEHPPKLRQDSKKNSHPKKKIAPLQVQESSSSSSFSSSSPSSYACLKCDKNFKHCRDLLLHIEHEEHGRTTEEPSRAQQEILLKEDSPLSIVFLGPTTDSQRRLPPFTSPVICCERSFEEPLELLTHQKYHHRSRPLKDPYKLQGFHCNSCTKAFNSHEALNRHVSLQCGLSFRCKACEARFKRVKAYVQHLLIVHSEELEEEDDNNNNNNHIMNDENKASQYNCSKCGLHFSDPEDLAAHAQVHKLTLKQDDCMYCDYVSAYEEDLRNHYEEKHAYPCEVCRKIFNTPQQLRSHEESSHKRPGLCPLCPMGFLTDDGLHAHLEGVHGGESTQKTALACGKCSFETLGVNAHLDHVKNGHEHSDD